MYLQDKEKDGKEDGAPEEKKGDDIVYAELDLAQTGGDGKRSVRPAEDKTEYAEIVGVAPQSDGDKSPRKSPVPKE